MAAAYSMGSAESRAEDSDARSSEPRPVLTGERLAPPNRASTLADDPQLLELFVEDSWRNVYGVNSKCAHQVAHHSVEFGEALTAGSACRRQSDCDGLTLGDCRGRPPPEDRACGDHEGEQGDDDRCLASRVQVAGYRGEATRVPP
jgi:hypothetical protein